MENFDDNFLARWISGDVSEEELSSFKKHPDYKKWLAIQQASNQISFSEFNANTSFEELKATIGAKNSKKKSTLLYKWLSGVAACAAIIIGILFLYNQDTTYKNSIAEQQMVVLPDGSEMLLNALSTAKVNIKEWETRRELFLDGEAYFKVKKGSTFSVHTSLGKVQVLGTQFSVNTVDNVVLTIKCYEGKVSVLSEGENRILTSGMAFQKQENEIQEWNFEKLKPTWVIDEETSLYKVPAAQVITLLKRQYQLKIKGQELVNERLLFTGSFSNSDLKQALYSVFGTLGVEYELISENEIRILSE
ncbi:FecR family protein [Aquimarina pacifica]|uniref:FecR family protein n=1 Tax=Aquimarina pacifica TaxID=1296415 RepID=UPI000472703A|nr:FecR family protein [Aquimarina pacifica]